FGIVCSTLLFITFLSSCFIGVNYSLGVIATIIYVGATGGTERESYRLIADSIPYLKRLDTPIKKSTVMVHLNLKLVRLLRHIKPDSNTIFEVVDDDFRVLKTLTEKDVRSLALRHSPHLTIKELLYPYHVDKPN
ncbi:MAG: hypothetical protein J6R35_01430, partial [Clostridia bacterium]|nr:hypothetical protein [Clostridia bacterium]